MNTSAPARLAVDPPLRFDQLLRISVCVALTLIPLVTSLPLWVPITIAASIGIRLNAAARDRRPPPQFLRLLVSVLAIGLLFLHYHTFNGPTAGSALLALMAGLKLLESESQRDIHIITLIVFFLCLAALLGSDSFWLLGYLVGVCWLTCATNIQPLNNAKSLIGPDNLRHSAVVFAQAAPLSLILWLFFPRFDGPLWELPAASGGAQTGLSDSMSPGDLSALAQSDDVAFRVHFLSNPPTPSERYWRGPVLSDFDGRTWRVSAGGSADGGSSTPGPFKVQGPAYRYIVSLEPHSNRWIYVLEWPTQWDLKEATLTDEYVLVQPEPVSVAIDVLATSYSHVQAVEPLSPDLRLRDSRLPPNRNPRTRHLAEALRAAHADDLGYVQSVLDLFRQQAFYYTLNPPKLGRESVDEFLFDSKRGFCGHYASAFATLMRAAGIPTRVVTGYQGGTFNRFADYWIMRQSDAHAWDEVWLEGRGWTRVDPTAAIDPQRVEHDSSDVAGVNDAQVSRWQRRTPWLANALLRLDAIKQMWRERIVGFDQRSQLKLLAFMRIPEPDEQKLVLVLAIGLILALLGLTWAVHRDFKSRPRDALARAYLSLCDKLERAELPRNAHEGAETYAARISAARPDLSAPITALCGHYTELRYGAAPHNVSTAKFAAAVRALTIK